MDETMKCCDLWGQPHSCIPVWKQESAKGFEEVKQKAISEAVERMSDGMYEWGAVYEDFGSTNFEHIDLNKPYAPREYYKGYDDKIRKFNDFGDKIDYIKLTPPNEAKAKSLLENGSKMEYKVEHDNHAPLTHERRQKELPDSLSTKEIITRWEKVEKEQNVEKVAKKYGVEDIAPKPDGDIQGILVFYFNVGQMSPPKAEEYCTKMLDKIKPTVDRVKSQGWDVLAMPVREGETRVEQLFFGEKYYD